MRGKFNSKRLVRVLVVLALCSCMIASIYVDVFASDSHLGKSNINTSGTFFSRTGQFDVLHYYGNSGDKFTISSTDVPSGCTIVGAYAVSYFRMSGHSWNCSVTKDGVTTKCNINQITIKKGSKEITKSGGKIYCDRRYSKVSGVMQWDLNTFAMTAVDISGFIKENGAGDYTCSGYKWTDSHNTGSGGENFSAYEVFVLVEKPSSTLTVFGIEGGAVSGYYDDAYKTKDLTIEASADKLKLGGGDITIWAAEVQDDDTNEDPAISTKLPTKISVGSDSIDLTSSIIKESSGHQFQIYEYEGTTGKTGDKISIKHDDVRIWDTAFGFSYALSTVSPKATSTITMQYVDTNNPESGITVTGKLINTTAETYTNTGLRKNSTLKIKIGSGISINSVTVNFNGVKIADTNISISGRTITANIPKQFINTREEGKDDKITYTVNCSQNGNASQAEFSASHVLSGKVLSMGEGTDYEMSFSSNTSMTARYRCNLSGVNTSSVSVSSNTGETSATGVFDYGATATISGIAKEGYHISSWSDGNTTGANTSSGSRTVSVTSNCNYVIYAEANNYRVDYNSGSSNH